MNKESTWAQAGLASMLEPWSVETGEWRLEMGIGQGWKKPRFLEKVFRFLGFLGFLDFSKQI